MTDAAFERDLRGYLEGSAPTDVPTSLHRTIASLSDADRARGQWFGRLASSAAAGVAIVLGLALAIIAAVSMPPSPDTPGSGGTAFTHVWRTNFATLQANSVSIEVGGITFQAPSDAVAKSNPGVARIPSLQIQWQDEGVPMNLDFSIHSDASSWWVSEILSSDGTLASDWISYRGFADAPLFLTPRGEAFNGDVDLKGEGRAVAARLTIDDMRLSIFGMTGMGAEQCTAVAAAPEPEGGPAPDPVEILSGYGVELGMEARDVDTVLAGHGFCRSYRLQFQLDGPRGFSQIWCVPPPGRVTDLGFGSDGDVVAFVDAGPDQSLPLIPPASVGC